MTPDLAPEQLLKAGVAALKRRDYNRAIATFKQLQNPSVPKSYQVKAQMGLVRAYEAINQGSEALKLCKPLLNSSSRHVRSWAEDKLKGLTQSSSLSAPEETTNSQDSSGFQPLVQDNDLSGFQPITEEKDQSGFQALKRDTAVQSPPPSNQNRAQPSPSSQSAEVLSDQPNAFAQTSPPSPEKSTQPSLFNYNTLNTHNSSPSPVDIDQPSQISDGVSPSDKAQSSSVANGVSPTDGDKLSQTADGVSSAPPSRTDTSYPKLPNGVSSAPPADTDDPSSQTANSVSPTYTWRYANRLKASRSLGKLKLFKVWTAQLITTVLLFGLLRYLMHAAMQGFNNYLEMLNEIMPFRIKGVRLFYQDNTWPLLIVLIIFGLASPWLWDLWLKYLAKMQSFSTRKLNPNSPESVQTLRRVCLRRNWPFPTLKLLPTKVPLIFSYGWLPRFARIVVSQGLLDQLKDDEIAPLYAYEMSHWKQWDWPLLSVQGLIMQVFYQIYWQLSLWGNQQPRLVHITAGVIANVSYGVFWLIHKAGVWMARLRTYYCDRTTTELTGNPNGLVRALGKMSLGLSQAVHEQGYTPPLIASLDLLLPTSATATQHSFAQFGHTPFFQLFAWDVMNPWRGWLSINQAHPPLGDRLAILTAYAQHWKLEPEINFQPLRSQLKNITPDQQQLERQIGRLQFSPWIGIIIGTVVGGGLLFIGVIANQMQISFLDW